MSDVRLASLPSLSYPLTKMGVKFHHPTSFLHGKAVPIFAAITQPGDVFKIDVAGLIRMSTPIFPIMGDIEYHGHSFFVPLRLIFEKTPEFFGENTETSGPQLVEYKLPGTRYGEGVGTTAAVGSVSHYLGKPLVGANGYYATNTGPRVNVLKERAYWAIINEYYRKQQLENPIQVYKDTGPYIGNITKNGVTTPITFATDPWTVAKKMDFFTSASISPQYSADPVYIPLGETAPVKTIDPTLVDTALLDPTQPLVFAENAGGVPSLVKVANGKYAAVRVVGHGTGSSDSPADFDLYAYNAGVDGSESIAIPANLVADLRHATASSVNTLRTAFATQRFLERDLFGTRYPELIEAHFGVKTAQGMLNRPQLLHDFKGYINISQVLSTADASNNTSTKLGQPGANSTTAFNKAIVHNAFEEWGVLMIIIETKHERVYSQGINAFDLKQTKFDFYFPEYATIGDQAIKQCQIFGQMNGDFAPDDVFGYQEAWAEYRYFPNRVSGLLDPNASGALDYMTLTDKFASNYVDGINEDFIKEDRNAIANCLVTSSGGPDYIADFMVQGSMLRRMPLYSIPGLIDHVGGR